MEGQGCGGVGRCCALKSQRPDTADQFYQTLQGRGPSVSVFSKLPDDSQRAAKVEKPSLVPILCVTLCDGITQPGVGEREDGESQGACIQAIAPCVSPTSAAENSS